MLGNRGAQELWKERAQKIFIRRKAAEDRLDPNDSGLPRSLALSQRAGLLSSETFNCRLKILYSPWPFSESNGTAGAPHPTTTTCAFPILALPSGRRSLTAFHRIPR